MAEYPSTFAEIDPATGIVKRVIVAEQDFINTGQLGDPANWIETSQDPAHKRKKYAGIGDVYDRDRDLFHAPEEEPAEEPAPKKKPAKKKPAAKKAPEKKAAKGKAHAARRHPAPHAARRKKSSRK